MSFLSDFAFLQEVNKHRVKNYYARITILDFMTEHPITAFEGKVTGGSINIGVNTPTRRTGSLNVVFDKSTFDLTNPDNLIAINKKVAISIGINNPFYDRGQWGGYSGPDSIWERYPPTLWFKQGIFIITRANSNSGTNSAQVQIQFIDKAGMLNGVCGGTIPANISLHDKWIIDGDGNVTVDYPIIRQIIQEVVHHFGEEHPSRIIINDIPEFGRKVITYAGTTPIRFPTDAAGNAVAGGFVISDRHVEGFNNVFHQGDDVGYMLTPLTFPGELTKNAGATVVQVLDAICNVLGNYEYFYDVDGYFIFQRIQHFQKTGEAPLDMTTRSPFNTGSDFDVEFQGGYLPRFSDSQFINEFMSTDLVSSVAHNPQFQEIRNDFVVWGSRQRDGEDSMVRMHLAIDNKPRETWTGLNSLSNCLCYQWIWEVRDTDNMILRYVFSPDSDNVTFVGAFGHFTFTGIPQYQEPPHQYHNGDRIAHWAGGRNCVFMWSGSPGNHAPPTTNASSGNWTFVTVIAANDEGPIGINTTTGLTIRLHSPSLRMDDRWTRTVRHNRQNHHAAIRGYADDSSRLRPENFNTDEEWRDALALPFEWREELYRMALRAWGAASGGSYYDAELLAEWRILFNPNSDNFYADWIETFPINEFNPLWTGYVRQIATDPSSIRFWLDIIDSNSPLGQYSVNRIGRRNITEDDSNIHEVLNRQSPDMVFIDGGQSPEDIQRAIQEQVMIGQNFALIQEDLMPLFIPRNSFGSCYEVIRELLHTHLIYNASVTVQSIPIFYLDVNRIVRLNFPEQGVVGNYIINRLSWNLGGNPRMSLTAQQAVVIV